MKINFDFTLNLDIRQSSAGKPRTKSAIRGLNSSLTNSAATDDLLRFSKH